MGIVRAAAVEALILHRRLWRWGLVVVIAWALFLSLQEPKAIRHAHIPLFWSGAEATTLLGLALLPLVWITARRPVAASWTIRLSATPQRSVLIPWLGITTYGGILAALTILVFITVYRIFTGSFRLDCGLALLQEAGLFLPPCAALAPALAHLRLPPHLTLLAWSAFLGTSLLHSFPLPTGSLLILQTTDLTMSPFSIESAAAALLATGGGLVLSVSLVRRSLATVSHAHRNPRRHP